MSWRAPRFLLDENLRGQCWDAVNEHNLLGETPIDALRVGDPPAPPLGTPDPEILIWAAAAAHILVTADKRTMPRFVSSHLAAGLHTAGVVILLPQCTFPELLQFLALAAHGSEAGEWIDRLEYVG